MITPTRLKEVGGLEDATDLLQELGFGGHPLPVDAGELGLGDFANNRVLRRGKSRPRGYAVFVAEVQQRPQTLKALRKRLVEASTTVPWPSLGLPPMGGRGSASSFFGLTWSRELSGRAGFQARGGRLQPNLARRAGLVVFGLVRGAKEAHERIDRGP